MQQVQDILTKAHVLRLQGQTHEAIELYQASIRLQPTAEAHNSLALSLSTLGKYEEAVEECLNAISINDSYWQAYNDLGSNLFKLDRIAEAIIWYEKAVKLMPEELSFTVYFNIGQAYETRNSWMEAMNYYLESLENNPKYEPSQDAVIRMSAFLN